MRTLYHPDTNDINLPSVLYALSDPIRLDIVLSLSQHGEQSCSALEIPIAKSTLSHHFKVLRESGIIFTRIEGTQRFISLRRDDLDTRFPGLIESILRAVKYHIVHCNFQEEPVE